MADRNDTIAAVATSRGRGGVAVVRVSGPDAFRVARAVAGTVPEPGRFAFARFRAQDGAALDEGLVLAFKAPRSYTGEDVVEFQCHGGVIAPRRVLDAALAAGARLARRGEFTERAFLAGKLSMDQAEAVLALVDAKTDRAADDALADLAGRAGARRAAKAELRDAYEELLDLSATVERSLDVDEGELPDGFFASLRRDVGVAVERLRGARRRMRERRMLRDGATVVLFGPPNAGKSSLLNALTGSSRAIVSATPGTTRDALEAWIDIDGWPVRLVDTAGVREPSPAEDVGEVESEGVRRAVALAKSADLVLLLAPSEKRGQSPEMWGQSPEKYPQKWGLSPQNIWGQAPEIWGQASQILDESDKKIIIISSKCDIARGAGLNVSSVTGEGIAELRQAIADALDRRVEEVEAADDAGTEADEADLGRALASVLEAQKLLAGPVPNAGLAGPVPNAGLAGPVPNAGLMGPVPNSVGTVPDAVLVGNALRAASGALGAALGATPSADVLDRLFSRFCVGK